MCGRFVSREQAAIEREYHIRVRDPFERVYNAAPSMSLPVVRRGSGTGGTGLEALAMRWGLIPGWWSQSSLPAATINARSEDAAAKPMWRAAVRQSRCLVPALGWYEWRAQAGGKVPYFIHARRLVGISFAGLCSTWTDPGGVEQPSFAILTRAASTTLAWLHQRMPVVLPPECWDEWLAPWPAEHAVRLAGMVARSSGEFDSYPVSRYVNSPRNQGERCIDRADGQAPPQ